MPDYTPTEMLVCLASRLMPDKTAVFIGTGIPMLAAALAKRTRAPDLLAVFEFGGMGSDLKELPLAVGEERTFRGGIAAMGICDVMEAAQRGLIGCGFLGGAQIDPYGNLNTTVIGPHDKPRVRLPGSGGGNDVASLCWQTIILMKHEKKRFLPKIDFVTSPGYLGSPQGRERAGLPADTGPYRVVTDLGLFDFPPKTRRMRLIALNPGITAQQVVNETGFKLDIARNLTDNPPPSAEELRILREEVDPQKIFSR